MKTTLPAEVLSRLNNRIASETAISFPRARWGGGELERKIRAIAHDMGFTDLAPFIEQFESQPFSDAWGEALVGHLAVGETFFWREKQVFAAFEDRILPELAARKRDTGTQLRIWSAGCSTGEDPYSIAIALNRASSAMSGGKSRILATDFNPVALRKATEGIYGEWSFRNTQPWLRDFFPSSQKREIQNQGRDQEDGGLFLS